MFRKLKFWFLVCGFTLWILNFGFSSIAQQAQEKETGLKAIEVGNKICPVSGKEIKADEAVKVEHEGKIYTLCCKMCEKDFKKNPKKYIQELEKAEKKEGAEHNEHEGHH